MADEQLTVLSLADDPARFAAGIGASFREYGFAVVGDHGIDSGLIAKAWRLTAEFFALPEAEKRRYVVAGAGGARGYTPFGIEIAKGAEAHDLKEFWHVGREPPEPGMAANVWPDRPEGFRETFARLFAEFDRVGAVLLDRIAVDMELPEDWFRPVIAGNNSVLRLLHYPPVADARSGAIRAGAHEDINLITLLLGAEESGLELLTRGSQWLPIAPPQGTLVVNIGDMLQRLTNHLLPSTTHRVRNPIGARARFSRYSMPFFLHPRSDFVIETLPGCVSAERPDRYPEGITADDYLQERLREIGLKA
ncbi:MAG: 2-oxoglutarate and iron-dependent oxygenase domain-containing protein [Novosphingobium sp.]